MLCSAKTAHPGRNLNVPHRDHLLVTVAATGALDLAAPDQEATVRQVGAVAALVVTETADPALAAPEQEVLDPRVVAPRKNAGSWAEAAAPTGSGATGSSHLKPLRSTERGG